MASGSQNMTTYYAKRIVGDASAAQANSALLQTGAGVAVDTWILNRTNRADTYGIKYVYDDTDGHDKVEFYGGAAAASAWVQLDTGDTYIAGKVGINYNPGTSGNTYQLYVSGSSYFTDTITGDSLSTWHILGGRPSNTTNFNTYFETIANLHHDNPARTDAEISYNRFFLNHSDQTTYGPSALNLPVVDQHVLSFGIDNGAVYSRHIAFDIRTNAVYVRARTSNTWGNWEQLVRNTGTWGISITGNAATATRINGNLTAATSDASRNIWVSSGAGADGIPNYISGFRMNPSTNVFTVPAGTRIYPSAGALYLGNSENQSWVYVQDVASQDSSKWKLHTNGNMEMVGRLWIQGGSEAGSNTNRLTTTSGTPGNMQYNTSRRGTQIYSNGIAFADPYNGNSNNDAGWIRHLETSANSAEFEIAVGDDGNEPIYVRQYNTSNAVARQIALLTAVGNTTIPGSFYFGGDGIYHSGTAATQRIIRIIDSGDQSGTGVSIGAGGLALFGSGESTSTAISNLSLTAGGTETTYITSDDRIEFYPSINGWDATARIWMTAGVLNIGLDGNSPRENSLNVYGGAGRIQLYSASSTTGDRGLWVPAHGSGPSKNIILVDTNNNITFNGNVTGNCSGSSGSCTGNAATATNLVGISMTGGNGNTGGRRLIYTWTISAWSNHRLTFAVTSRHTGSGLVAVSVGCNSSTVSLANCYAEIKYFGPTGSGNIISSTSYEIYINSAGTTAYLFWQYSDYNATSITPISGGLPSNGTWTENPASYGTLKAQTEINVSSTCYGNAATATTASTLASYASIGSSTTDHGVALKNWFTANKSTAPRNKIISFYSATSGNGSQYMGYFLSGYADNPYGGFFVCHYNNPYYVGISNGTYTQQHILTSTNYTSYTVTKTGSGASGSWGISVTGSSASCTGNAATATKATQDGSGNTITSKYVTVDTAQTITGTKSWGTSGTGGQLNGAATNGGINSIRVGDDVWLGDCNAGGIMGMKSTGANTGFYFYNSSGTQTGQLYANGTGIYCNKTLELHPSSGNYTEGIRIYPYSNWATIMLLSNGTDTKGVASDDWGIFNNSGTLYINKGSSSGAGNQRVYANANGWYFTKAYGAVWNDFAEYRKVDIHEPGYAIAPSGRRTTQRLESGARITSDTYGYAIGYMENRKDLMPVAIAGRVLAYPLYNKSYYKVGDTVCAVEGGKIDKMTREEIKEYPDRIIGIVNEIPDYDIWEPSREGGGREPIHTNGRIWIDVR